MDDHGRIPSSNKPILYVLDTNVLIHDPNALLNFEEHHVAIPMTVLEELDKLKAGKLLVAAECRQAIRLIDQLLGVACPKMSLPACCFWPVTSPAPSALHRAHGLAG